MKYKSTFLYIFIFLLSGVISCEKDEENQLFPSGDFISSGSYQGEYWPTQGWRFCSPEEVGMDSEKLKELNHEIQILLELHIDVNTVLIVKDGYIVAEQYYSEDYGVDSLHRIHSCTKSITSALVGIAIEQGYIPGVNSTMTGFFPDYEIENLSDNKEKITLEHMLTMSAGLEWYEIEYPYDDDRNTFRQWVNSDDMVKYVLDQPTTASPGYEFSYNTGISHLLSAIIERSTGMRTDSFAYENLFTPLGIERFRWPHDAMGISFGGSSMRMLPRDMAKFGYLYLKNGWWDGEQIVPEEWVDVSQQKHMARKYIPDDYYGYQWWVSDKNRYSAVGFAGQWITIVPDQDLVVVFTNQFEEGVDLQWSTPERLLETYILPSIY